MTFSEQVRDIWQGGGFMMWPLAAAALIGLVIIVWKLFDLSTKSLRTRKFLREVDELIAQRKIDQALALSRDSNTPAGRILAAGLERRHEGSERVMKAIENVGLIEMAGLESGLVWLATVSNVAPLLGFLGTVIGMIQAFQAIEAAGEVEATLVAGGIKVALITTATGLAIAIPINIAHNYFVTRVDRLVIDMEESAQKMVDALHEPTRATA
jgi:biopolymer transport protein ExbB